MALFRPYNPADADDLREMILSLYSEDPPGQEMSAGKIVLTVKALTEHSEKGRILLIAEAGETAGYAILSTQWSNEYGGDILTIDELYLKPEWRGRGIGTSFFAFLEREYRGKAVALHLEVTPANERAFRLYHRLGFDQDRHAHLLKPI